MTCKKMGWLRPILPILLASAGLQLCLARPQGQWELKNSQQVAQPILVHSAEESPFPFPRFAIPENRRQDNPWSLVPNEVQQVENPNVRKVRPGDQVAIVVRDHQQEKPQHTDVISLLASLKDIQSSPAHPVFLAPYDYPAPQGAKKFNVTYVVPAHVQDQPASNPHPPLFVAPLHYQVPSGYGRIQVPVRHVKFAIPESPVATLIATQQPAAFPDIPREQPQFQQQPQQQPHQEFVQAPPPTLVQQQPVAPQFVPQPQNIPAQWESPRPTISNVVIPNVPPREQPQPQQEFVQVLAPIQVEQQPVPQQFVPQPQPVAVQWEPVRPTTSNPWIASVAEPAAAFQPDTVPVQDIPVQAIPVQEVEFRQQQQVRPIQIEEVQQVQEVQEDEFRQQQQVRPLQIEEVQQVQEVQEVEFRQQQQVRPLQTEEVQQVQEVQEVEFRQQQVRPLQTEEVQQVQEVQEVEFRHQSENKLIQPEEVQQIQTVQQGEGNTEVQSQDLFQVQEPVPPVQQTEGERFVLAADKPAFLENEELQQQLLDVPPFNEVTPVRDQVSVPLVLAVERPAFLDTNNAGRQEPVAQEEPVASPPLVEAAETPFFHTNEQPQLSEPVMEHGFRPLFPITQEEPVQSENDQAQFPEEVSSEDQFQATLELQREEGLRHATFVPEPAFERVPTLFEQHTQDTASVEPEVSVNAPLPVPNEPTLFQTEEVRTNFEAPVETEVRTSFEAPIQTEDVQIPVAVQNEEVNNANFDFSAQIPEQRVPVEPVFIPASAEPVETLRGDVSPKDDGELQSIQPLEVEEVFNANPVVESDEQVAPVVEQTVAPTPEKPEFVPQPTTTTVQPVPEPTTAAPQVEVPRGRIVPASAPVKVSLESDTVSSPTWPDFQSVRRKQINRQQINVRQNIQTEVVRNEEPVAPVASVAPVLSSGQGAVYGQKLRPRVKSNLFVPTESAPRPTLAVLVSADPDPPVIEREEPFQLLESQNSPSATASASGRGRTRFRPKSASSEESSESQEQGTTTTAPVSVTTITAPSRRRPASTTAPQRIRGRVRVTTPTTTVAPTTTEAVTESIAPKVVEVVEEEVSTPVEEPITNEAPETEDLVRAVQENMPRAQEDEEVPLAALEEETNEERNENAVNEEEVIEEIVLVEEEPEVKAAPVITERPITIRGRRPQPKKEEETETTQPPRRRRPINRFRDSSSFRSAPTQAPTRPHLFRPRPAQPVVDLDEPEEISSLREGFSPLSLVFGTRQASSGRIAAPSTTTTAPLLPVGRRVPERRPQGIRIARPVGVRGSGEDLGSEGSEWNGASGPSISGEVDDTEDIIVDREPVEDEKTVDAMETEDVINDKVAPLPAEMTETETEDSVNDKEDAPVEVQTDAGSEDVAESDPATEETHEEKPEKEEMETEDEKRAVLAEEGPMNTETSEIESATANDDVANDALTSEVKESETRDAVEPSETAITEQETKAEGTEAAGNENEAIEETVLVTSEKQEDQAEDPIAEVQQDTASELSTPVEDKADEPTEVAETADQIVTTEVLGNDKAEEANDASTAEAVTENASVAAVSAEGRAIDSQAADSQVLGVSTATEVSLMYELCFRGRCIRVHE